MVLHQSSISSPLAHFKIKNLSTNKKRSLVHPGVQKSALIVEGAKKTKIDGDKENASTADTKAKSDAICSVFVGLQIAIEFSASVPYKEKKLMRECVTRQGGVLSYVLTSKVNFVAVSDVNVTDSYKCRKAMQLGIPVVSCDFLRACQREEKLLDYDDFIVAGFKRVDQLNKGRISTGSKAHTSRQRTIQTLDWRDFNPVVSLPDLYADYQVPKWAFLSKLGGKKSVCVLEVHVVNDTSGHNTYRVYSEVTLKSDSDMPRGDVSQEVRLVDCGHQAELLFASLYGHYEGRLGYTKSDKIVKDIGSPRLQEAVFAQSLDDIELNSAAHNLVDGVWQEAVGEVDKFLSVSVDSVSKSMIEEAEAILMLLRDALKDPKKQTDLNQLRNELANTLPLKPAAQSLTNITKIKDITRYQNMCQLLDDLISVGETSDWSMKCTTLNKIKSLGSYITESHDAEADSIKQHFIDTLGKYSKNVEVKHVYAVKRPQETFNSAFRTDKKRQLLYHASLPENYLGILSRGLLLPKIVVDDIGGQRTDYGLLGHGIYFADKSGTSLQYSKSSNCTGTRLMLVCDVVIGEHLEAYNTIPNLTEAPQGYDSVLGVESTPDVPSVFKANEYVVYKTDQQKLMYLVEYTLPEDKTQTHEITAQAEDVEITTVKAVKITDKIDLDDVENVTLQEVEPGLVSTSDKPLPLKNVHVMASLVDLAANVTVLQEYINSGTESIEAKFVFPLGETAAVCGFEAYINGKHIVGEVKEKQKAHREYRQAISEGHGAYLMDQDKERPDVFTVSVGNLPPNAQCFIKITYVCELMCEDEALTFELPANIAPWKAKQAMAENTQADLSTVKMGADAEHIETSVNVCLRMAYEIRSITSSSHRIQIKKTATHAMVNLVPGQQLNSGFNLQVKLAEIHVPRMIIEADFDDMQASLLTFYPEFDCESNSDYQMILMLDNSNSMSADDLLHAKKLALMMLNYLPREATFNVISFASVYSELFPKCMPAYGGHIKAATKFIKELQSKQGNTDLLTPLTNTSLLASNAVRRNIAVISDGQFSNGTQLLQRAGMFGGNIRLFSLAVGKDASKFHMRELSYLSAGSYEYFNSSTKSKWQKQLKGIIDCAAQPVLKDVKVTWQNEEESFVQQAPANIPAIFNGHRLVVYGLCSHVCLMATLTAQIDGQEVSTVVSASELSSLVGSTIHCLAARAIIKSWENENIASDPLHHEAKKRQSKLDIIELSKRYSIVTQFTSFVAVEKREEGEDLSTGKGPSLNELKEQIRDDPLPYMEWESRTSIEKSASYPATSPAYSPTSPAYSEYDEALLSEEDEELYYEEEEEGVVNFPTIRRLSLLSSDYMEMYDDSMECTGEDSSSSVCSDYTVEKSAQSREEKLEDMIEKSEELQKSASEFKKSTTKLMRKRALLPKRIPRYMAMADDAATSERIRPEIPVAAFGGQSVKESFRSVSYEPEPLVYTNKTDFGFKRKPMEADRSREPMLGNVALFGKKASQEESAGMFGQTAGVPFGSTGQAKASLFGRVSMQTDSPSSMAQSTGFGFGSSAVEKGKGFGGFGAKIGAAPLPGVTAAPKVTLQSSAFSAPPPPMLPTQRLASVPFSAPPQKQAVKLAAAAPKAKQQTAVDYVPSPPMLQKFLQESARPLRRANAAVPPPRGRITASLDSPYDGAMAAPKSMMMMSAEPLCFMQSSASHKEDQSAQEPLEQTSTSAVSFDRKAKKKALNFSVRSTLASTSEFGAELSQPLPTEAEDKELHEKEMILNLRKMAVEMGEEIRTQASLIRTQASLAYIQEEIPSKPKIRGRLPRKQRSVPMSMKRQSVQAMAPESESAIKVEHFADFAELIVEQSATLDELTEETMLDTLKQVVPLETAAHVKGVMVQLGNDSPHLSVDFSTEDVSWWKPQICLLKEQEVLKLDRHESIFTMLNSLEESVCSVLCEAGIRSLGSQCFNDIKFLVMMLLRIYVIWLLELPEVMPLPTNILAAIAETKMHSSFHVISHSDILMAASYCDQIIATYPLMPGQLELGRTWTQVVVNMLSTKQHLLTVKVE